MRTPFLTSLLIVFTLSLFAQINPKNITIARDNYGVPHIFAPTDAEAAYGLAWAHAEDNFRDIQLALYASKNMLGRVEGIDGALFDFALQFLSIDSLVEARYELDLSLEYRTTLSGYVQGINDYAAAHPKEVMLKKAFPVTERDAVKGYTLTGALLGGLGLALKAANEGRIGTFMNINDVGSNAMAVAPDHMADGKGTYLLNNSHQPIDDRFAWYEAHVNSEEGWNIIGGLFPGGMTIFVGTNEKLGWAHTTNYHNFGDVYELEINPENKKQYKYDGEWRNLVEKKARLKVKLGPIKLGVKRKYWQSEYGPVFKTKKYGKYAFRFPGYMDIRIAEQWYHMNKAQSFEEFQTACRMQAIPLFNIIYGDGEGNIMLHSGGKVPDRNPELNWSYPITANTSAYKWDRILPYERLPHVENPDCGYVFNANNTPLRATGESCNWDEYFVGLQQFMYNRGDLFDQILAAHEGPFTEEYLNELKFHTGYAKEGEYMKHFINLYTLDENKYPDIADAIAKMKKWNLRGEADNMEAALAMVAHDFLRQKIKAPFAFLMIQDKLVSEEDAVWALTEAKKLLMKTHGTIDLPLGDVQRLIRGDKSLPASGLREVPRATDTYLYKKKQGIFRVKSGDGYMQIVRFTDGKPEIRSVHPYGASNHEDSPHYTDQMEMFTNYQFKKMTFDKDTIIKNAERVYHPGE